MAASRLVFIFQSKVKLRIDSRSLLLPTRFDMRQSLRVKMGMMAFFSKSHRYQARSTATHGVGRG